MHGRCLRLFGHVTRSHAKMNRTRALHARSYTWAALQIQDRSPKSRPLTSLNQSQMQLTRPVVTGLGLQRAPGLPSQLKPLEASSRSTQMDMDMNHRERSELTQHRPQHGNEHRITNSGEEQLKQLDILEISRLVCTSIRHLPSRWNWNKKTAGSRWTYFDSRVPRNWTIRS